jgi:hypothetical protein
MQFIDDPCDICGGNEYEKRGARGVTYCLKCEQRGQYSNAYGVDYLESYTAYAYGVTND